MEGAMRLNRAAPIRLPALAAMLFAVVAPGQSLLAADLFSETPSSPVSYRFSALETAAPSVADTSSHVTPAALVSEISASVDAAPLYGAPGYAGNLAPVCQDCPSRGLYAFLGYDGWRGV